MTTTTSPPQRLDRRALFETLGYRPHAGQLLVHRSKAPRRVLACGVRWGKTTCSVYECIAALLEPCKGSIGWVCAPTYDLSERIFGRVVGELKKHFAHRVREHSARERRLVVVNFGGGLSTLVSKSADNPDSLLGEGLDFLVIDEASRLDRRVYEEHLSQRLLDKRGWLLALSTPRGMDWFHKLYKRGQRRRDPDFESWASPSSANPMLDPALIEAERARLPADVFNEQFGAMFVGVDDEPCGTCGYPSSKVSGLVMGEVSTEQRCDECGLLVDEQGRTIMAPTADGKPAVTYAVFRDRRDGSECLIECVQPLVGDGGRPQVDADAVESEV